MVAGHLQEKKGMFYIVLTYKDAAGKRKTVWQSTALPVRGNKKKAEALLQSARASFKIPVQDAPTDDDLLFSDFLARWLLVVKDSIQITTYASYCQMANSIIIPYFKAKGITLRELRATDIQTFYTAQLERVCANSVIHYHAVIHKALKYAVKIDLIEANPADKIERPKKNTLYYRVVVFNDPLQGHVLHCKGCCGSVKNSHRETVHERLRPQPLAVLLIS